MNDAQFRDHVDRLGDDIRTWPHALRSEAEDHLSQSAFARSCIAEARLIRETFSGAAEIRAPKSLADSLFAKAFGGEAPQPFTPPKVRSSRHRAVSARP